LDLSESKGVISIILLMTAGLVIIIDQFSKLLVRNLLAPSNSIGIVGFFRITRVENPGAAFGLLPNYQLIFLLTTFLVALFIVLYYRRLRSNEYLIKLALGLELGGALGNLIDRVFFGHVTDFFDLRIWPVFNFADIAIVLGLLAFVMGVLSSYLGKQQESSLDGQH
jgi:signal peptidase II